MFTRSFCPAALIVVFVTSTAVPPTQAQSASPRGANTYLECPDAAAKFATGQTLAAIRVAAARSLSIARGALAAATKNPQAAISFCYAAELWKLTGDMGSASQAYEAAIAADPNEAALRFLFGEYLRNWRALF